jgi:hypothetical protein
LTAATIIGVTKLDDFLSTPFQMLEPFELSGAAAAILRSRHPKSN